MARLLQGLKIILFTDIPTPRPVIVVISAISTSCGIASICLSHVEKGLLFLVLSQLLVLGLKIDEKR